MFKKIFILIIIVSTFAPFSSRASTFDLITEKKDFAIGEQFVVDYKIDLGNDTINGIESNIEFSRNLSLVKIDESSSVVSNWIEKTQSENSLFISGIIPAGFSSFVDAKTGNKLSSEVLKLVFEPKDSGQAYVNFTQGLITLNNGEGSVLNIPDKKVSVNINNKTNIKKLETALDFVKPDINYQIIQESSLYDGQKVLVFNATDKQTGIEGVYIKENNSWTKIINPYLLNNKSKFSIIEIKAVDNAGNETIIKIVSSGIYILISILALVVIAFAFYVHYSNKKKYKI